MITVKIQEVADMVAREKCGREGLKAKLGDDQQYRTYARIVRDWLVKSVQAGDIEATKVDLNPRLPTFLHVCGSPMPKHVPKMGIGPDSEITAQSVAKALTAAGLPIPDELLSLLSKEDREQFDPQRQVRELNQREREKREVFPGLLIMALAPRDCRKPDGSFNLDRLADIILNQVCGEDGRAPYGLGKTTIKAAMTNALAAAQKVSTES